MDTIKSVTHGQCHAQLAVILLALEGTTENGEVENAIRSNL